MMSFTGDPSPTDESLLGRAQSVRATSRPSLPTMLCLRCRLRKPEAMRVRVANLLPPITVDTRHHLFHRITPHLKAGGLPAVLGVPRLQDTLH